MKSPDVIDARGGDYISTTGAILTNLIRNKLNMLESTLATLMKRMENEMTTKEEAISLMIAIADELPLNEKALFLKACVDRCSFLQKEHRELRVLGQSFDPKCVYKINVADAVRFGLA